MTNILITKYLDCARFKHCFKWEQYDNHFNNLTHFYTSELLLPGIEQEVGADGFQCVEGSLQALEVAPSLVAERILHHFIETHHSETLSRIWLVGP